MCLEQAAHSQLCGLQPEGEIDLCHTASLAPMSEKRCCAVMGSLLDPKKLKARRSLSVAAAKILTLQVIYLDHHFNLFSVRKRSLRLVRQMR